MLNYNQLSLIYYLKAICRLVYSGFAFHEVRPVAIFGIIYKKISDFRNKPAMLTYYTHA
jgi:hypothetical protein